MANLKSNSNLNQIVQNKSGKSCNALLTYHAEIKGGNRYFGVEKLLWLLIAWSNTNDIEHGYFFVLAIILKDNTFSKLFLFIARQWSQETKENIILSEKGKCI